MCWNDGFVQNCLEYKLKWGDQCDSWDSCSFYCYGSVSIVVHRFLISSQELLGQSLPNLVCSICMLRRCEILYLVTPTPRGDNFRVKKVKLMGFLAHLSWKLKWAFLITCRPSSVRPSVYPSVCLSVNFSHFHLLLQNHWANFNQTWHKVFLGEGDSSLFKWRATPFPKGR